nr:DapH/DapD/GlmU-related protein [Microbacterium sp. BH-3-3-3]
MLIGDNVLIGRGVHISDHSHEFSAERPIRDQGISEIRPVEIHEGVWIGQNAVISPGVTIGAFAVVGANSVVTKDVPPRVIVGGVPAKIIRDLRADGGRR